MKQSIFPKPPKKLLDKIREAECGIIIGHMNPDGDALSSSVAMKLIFEEMGKEAVILNDGPVLRHELQFLKSSISEDVPSHYLEKKALVVIVDCSTEDRPGESYKKVKAIDNVIVIDHHSAGQQFVADDCLYQVPSSPSTTILVDVVRQALGVKLSQTMAFYLYIGLLTDTGFFHFIGKSVAPEVFERATEFVKTGLDPYSLYDLMNDGKDFGEIKEVCAIIENSESFFDGKLIIATQPEFGEKKRLSDVVYQELLKVANVEVVVFLKPQGETQTEVGFRSKRNAQVDVGTIALDLGGGGHRYASGATVNENVEDIKKTILRLFFTILH